jgi:hypothetical protein
MNIFYAAVLVVQGVATWSLGPPVLAYRTPEQCQARIDELLTRPVMKGASIVCIPIAVQP